jgi:hypothetical protein
LFFGENRLVKNALITQPTHSKAGITTNKLAAALVLILSVMMLLEVLAKSASANFKPYQPPKITVLSPSPNETYNSSTVPLNVRIALYGIYPWANDDITSLNYTIDGQQDVPMSFARDASGIRLNGNGTLSGLSNGLHSVMVHGESIMNAESILFNASVTFTVEATITIVEQEPLPIAFAAMSSSIVAVVAVAGLVYLKKRKRKAEGERAC